MRRILAGLAFLAAAFHSATANTSDLCPAKILVHANGAVDFDGESYSDNVKLKLRLAEYWKRHPDCVPSINADRGIRYETVGKVVVMLQEAGFMKVGYLMEPSSR